MITLLDTLAPLGAPVSGPSVALHVQDPVRRRLLADVLDARGPRPDQAEAEVCLIDLPEGAPLSEGLAAGDIPVLLLSDDATWSADPRIAGLLPRTAPPRQVAAAVAALAEGLTVRLCHAAPPAAAILPELSARPTLTPREREVLHQVGEGLSNKAIARRLGISAHTVKYHLEAVFAKLGVRSRTEAVGRSLRQGLPGGAPRF